MWPLPCTSKTASASTTYMHKGAAGVKFPPPPPYFGHGSAFASSNGRHSFAPYGPSQHLSTGRQHFFRQRWVSRAAKSASPSSDSALKVGSLVEYRKDADKSVLVLLVEPNGKANWWGVDQVSRKQSIQPKQVSLVLPSGSYKEADVAAFVAAAEAADMGDLEVAWEIAADGGAPLSLADLASLLFDAQGAKELYVMHRMLAADRVYFKQVGKQQGLAAMFEAKPASQVAAMKKFVEEEAAARRDQEAFTAAVNASLKCKTRQEQPSAEAWLQGPHSKRISALMEVALSQENATLAAATLAAATESLQLAGAFGKGGAASAASSPGLRSAASNLLMDLRVLQYHEPLEIRRFGLGLRDLPAPLVAKAQELLASPPADPAAAARVDLSHLAVYTIDDEGTVEVDDGLSVELLEGGGIKIWIHVADPTRWLSPGDALDLEARRRSRSLYLPWGFVPMFPRDLAAGPFSLEQGEVCNAMSVGVVLSADGAVADYQVASTKIKVSNKLSYDDVDQMLSQQEACPLPDLCTLSAAAQVRQKYREGQGCIEIPLPEAKLTVPPEDLDSLRPRVAIKRLSQWESPSRQLVAEMMILAGEAVGRLGSQAGLPLPFRGQETPVLPRREELEAVPAGPCRGYMLRTCMTRSSVTSKPQRHASLGLDAYVQFTSPIRRYADLIAHFQVRAHIQGLPLPFSAAAIDSIMAAMQEEARPLNMLEREQENYWLSEFFQQRPEQPWDALMLGWFREENRLACVLFDDLGWETITRISPDLDVKPGDQLQLLLVEGRSGDAASPQPRFTVTAHFSSSEEGMTAAVDRSMDEEGKREEEEDKQDS